ncbi:MAG: TIGR04348 family glycosyltransferase [Rhodospirillaceae bacterium]|nr:TIGR04348 family glycosyltransferase [Rhodospirillaceae bacterium]
MKISLITPAKKHSKNGNRASALRWAGFLRDQGHRVRIDVDYTGEPADLMIALHAWRSADAILRYRERFPGGPLIVALGGTDVNTFLKTDPDVTLRSMQMADAMVCLHDLIAQELPKRLRNKLHVVRQSAEALPVRRNPGGRHFDVCVVGHLREEKDPYRAALAARLVPEASKLRVIHFGKAHSEEWAERARAEMVANPRYIWKGEVPRWRVRREFVRTRLMVISSNQEGGANVVSEAVVAGVPVIASDIAGNIGLLGLDYEGYYPVRDANALAVQLHRAEVEDSYLRSLEVQCEKLRSGFTPAREAAGWKKVIATVT